MVSDLKKENNFQLDTTQAIEEVDKVLKETAELANSDGEPMPAGNAMEQEMLKEQEGGVDTPPATQPVTEAEPAEKVGRGVKPGTKRGTYNKKASPKKQVAEIAESGGEIEAEDEKVDMSDLLNSSLIAPSAAFFIKDPSAAMLTPEQAKILNKLTPKMVSKPSWGALIGAFAFFTAGNIAVAWKAEKRESGAVTNGDLTTFVQRLTPDQIQQWCLLIEDERKKRNIATPPPVANEQPTTN